MADWFRFFEVMVIFYIKKGFLFLFQAPHIILDNFVQNLTQM